jgi:eukaryotic-like serine/threonine-protein kinase
MSSAPAGTTPDRVLGKYQIVRPLKLGGTAAIYLAISRGENNFSREVVIKRPLPHLLSDPRSRLMFIDEAHIAARLSHPNICQVLDLVAREDECYLVMEYLRGVDLREILKRCFELNRYISPEVAVWIAIEISTGLDFAHEAVGLDGQPLNLVHRDLSPKNIRITFSGSVKVIDFGIARAMNRATETAAGTIKGTLGYMSPEQILGDEIDRRTDIFAFGICLFQTLTGRNPFDGSTLKERVKKLTQSPIPSVREHNPTLDDEIAGIVAKCLERDVDERYQRLRDVQIDLDRYLARLGVVSPRQKLIQFLEEIFPDHGQADSDLNSALSEAGSQTGKIDTEQRLRFPDDPPTDTNQPAGTNATGATQPESPVPSGSATRPTIEPSTAAGATRPVVRQPSKSEDSTRYNDTRMTPAAQPPSKKTGLLIAGAIAFAVALGIVGVSAWPKDSIEAIAIGPDASIAVPPVTPPPPAVTPPPPAVVPPPPAVVPPPGTDVPPVTPPPPATVVPPPPVITPPPPPPVKPPPSKDRPQVADKDRARLYFRTARRLEQKGRSEDARLLYVLAYAQGGKNPDPAIYLNLGLLHNKDGNVPKAKACLRGYLERRPDVPEAERVRTVLSSFPSTKSVPCVDPGELGGAKKDYSRRGATIDGWVEETMSEMLK